LGRAGEIIKAKTYANEKKNRRKKEFGFGFMILFIKAHTLVQKKAFSIPSYEI